MNYNSSYYSLLFPLLSLFLQFPTISHYFDYFPLFLVTISLKNMENNPESKEPTSSEIESKEGEIADGSGERKEVVATAADSEKEEILKKETKIEQRPFLTQSELLIKMKSGNEEEVKRCQIMIDVYIRYHGYDIIVPQKYPCCCDLRAFLRGQFSLKVFLCVKDLTFRNSGQ